MVSDCNFTYDADCGTCGTCGFILCGHPPPIRRRCDAQPVSSFSAGTELKALLKDWLGIESTPTCSCNAMARRMDTLGPDWSEGEGMTQILDVMRAEHGKRWAAGKTLLPWTDAGARQLVLLACRRSRAKAAG